MENLRKTAVRVAIRQIERFNKLMKMPISQFMGLVEDIIEADDEIERRREEIRHRKQK